MRNISLSIKSNVTLKKYYLKTLSDIQINFELDKKFDLETGWYNLIIEYTGEKIDIEDILINGESLSHYIYTGFFTEKSTGKRFQPANSLWTEGEYSIWIHTEIGHMIQTYCTSIRNGDYGKNLFDDYLFTVDKNLEISTEWPEIIKSYFRYGNGPRWWKKDTKKTPYEVCEKELLQDIDKNKVLSEIKLDCHTKFEYKMLTKVGVANTEKMYGLGIRRSSAYPYIDIDSLKSSLLKTIIRRLGFKELLNITLQTALPGQSFVPHIDDHYKRDCRDDIEGPVVFLWNLATVTKDHYFKLGSAGVLPLEHGLFFNQFYFDHGTINDSKEHDRPLLIIHGLRDKKFGYI